MCWDDELQASDYSISDLTFVVFLSKCWLMEKELTTPPQVTTSKG
jgi:hypothetical protein